MDNWRRFRIGGGGGGGGGGNGNTNGGATLSAVPSTLPVDDAPGKGKGRALDERLWGLENFGNTCYCNSILQALYASPPFRVLVEAYPEVAAAYNALGGPIAKEPLPSPSLEPKANPLDSPAVTSPTKEKRGGILGLGKSKNPTTPQKTIPAPMQPTQQAPPPIVLPPDPNFPDMTLFSTVQTLFHHMSTSLPHLPAAPKPGTAAAALATNATGSGAASLPSASLVAAPTTPGGTPGQPQGPSLLASLPPPSTIRGGGPYAAGSLGRGVVRPEDVLRTVRRHHVLFAGQGQQDAHEFLGFMLNQLAEEVEALDRKLKDSNAEVTALGPHKTFVHSLFHGVLVNETRCLNCETTSSREESFLDLSIDIEQHSSLTACLRQFSHSEMLCSTNKFYCETCCGLVEAERRMRIKTLPNILGLHLKRFRQDDMGRLHKLFYRVTFPLTLRVPCTTEDTEEAERLYELFAVVVHIGNGPTHGHYVTVVRSEGKWVMCDDENVEPIEESDLANYFGDNITGAGYVLFYQAVDLDLMSLGLKKMPEMKTPMPTLSELPAEQPVSEIHDDVLTPMAASAPLPVDHGSVFTEIMPPKPRQPAPAVPAIAPPVPPVKAPQAPPAAPQPAAKPVTPTPPVPVPATARSTSPAPAHNGSSSPASSAGTPDGSVRRRSTSRGAASGVRREPSGGKKWYSLKRRDSATPERTQLQRQGTATTLGTVNTVATASSTTGEDMASSMLSTQSAASGKSAPAAVHAGFTSQSPGHMNGSSRIGRSVSTTLGPPSAPSSRTASGTAMGNANNGYAGGGNLGRRLSDRTGLGKLTRSTSSAWKMGFGKKGKVDE